jgi:hypothetical protein
MAFGRRSIRQDELFIPAAKLATGPGHPFYPKLNEVLAGTGFDEWVEELCAPYYKACSQVHARSPGWAGPTIPPHFPQRRLAGGLC